MSSRLDKAIVCVIGLGYVGLPLAIAFAKSLKVIAFDVSGDKILQLKKTNNVQNLIFTNNHKDIAKADFDIICVPTPLTEAKEPDLSYVKSAAETVGQNMKPGAVVILESTVYPGVTEEVVKPILEKVSGLKCGADFKVAYSPERINPGDDKHSIDKVTKVVAGMDAETTELVAELYARVAPQVFKAKNIKTAEASKAVENTQRDLNIALMNELAIVFEKMGLNSKDVLDAAATKWNFHRYSPGLVGGYCIPIVPQYLVHRAKELGYVPQVILAGRTVNDFMPKHVAEITIKALKDIGKTVEGAKILVMGLTYKENVAETREAPVWYVIKELREYGVQVFTYDPLVNSADIEQDFSWLGIKALSSLKNASGIDCVVLSVGHDAFKKIALTELKGIMNDKPALIDIRGFYDSQEAKEKGIYYKSL